MIIDQKSLSAGRGKAAEVTAIPHHFEAEQAVLGAFLVDGRIYPMVAEIVGPDHFADPGHARLFRAAGEMLRAGRSIDGVMLGHALAHDPALADLGGAAYVAALMAACPAPRLALEYARTIRDLAARRDGIALSRLAAAEFADLAAGETAAAVIARLERNLSRLSCELPAWGEPAGERVRPLAAGVAQALARRREGTVGLASGIAALDALTGGWRPGDLIVLAGRPGMGKTALAHGMALTAAGAGHGVLFAALEMSAEHLGLRALAAAAGIDAPRIERGTLDAEENRRLAAAAETLSALPLFIDDGAVQTPAGLAARARRLARADKRRAVGKAPLGLIVVDYLQLMRPDQPCENRTQEVAAVTRALKGVAKDLGVPLLALSQLSRAVESREDKRPQLADLRDSGTIEQDADMVLFLYRDEYYAERARPSAGDERPDQRLRSWTARMALGRGQAEMIVAKHRRGPLGTLALRFWPHAPCFSDPPS